ncbi:MAG: hypothetical protein M3294_07120 [Pseudomonadota bacterium]|jgi:hypothetical protein|nr:hypothetical protein [Pseudomonadota bacterium]
MPLTATTLTRPVRKQVEQRVAADAGLRSLFEDACRGLSIAPAQLHQELEAGGDIPDLVSGALSPQALRLAAKTLALMRYLPESERLPDLNRELTGD